MFLWSVPVQGITISESSQLSSVSQLGRSHPVSPLRLQIALAQSRDCTNVLRSLQIGCAISRLARNFGILRMRSAISRVRKFLDCVEHIYTEWLTIFQSYLKWSEWDTAWVWGYIKNIYHVWQISELICRINNESISIHGSSSATGHNSRT